MDSVYLSAPAKINIHLEIQKKRMDGYHDILSLFQVVSLYDRMQFSILNQENAIIIKGFNEVPQEKNIIWEAIYLFRQHSGISSGVSVLIDKQIPVQAGLGGGSSDAAATLRVLNYLFSHPLPQATLNEIGAKLGSDVCFFLNSPAALVSGRGENIEPVHPRLDIYFILIVPEYKISTRDAYLWFDGEAKKPASKRISKKKLKLLYESTPPGDWYFYNSFSRVIGKRYPEMETIRQELNSLGVPFASLSGSGSAIFAIFDVQSEAKSVFAKLKKRYAKLFLLRPLENIPEIRLMKNEYNAH